jgi:hypothetical protein
VGRDIIAVSEDKPKNFKLERFLSEYNISSSDNKIIIDLFSMELYMCEQE